MKNSSFVFLAFAAVLTSSIFIPMMQQAFADHPEMRAETSGGTLEVLLEPSPQPIEDTESTQFKLTFLQPGTDSVQEHVDYDFIIIKGGQEVFKASVDTGQPLLHTTEGTVTIPYKFEEQGDHTVRIVMAGIRFIPIDPETAEFAINVTPEFPAGIIAPLAAALAFAAILKRTSFKMK